MYDEVENTYQKVLKDIKKGDFTGIGDLHALVSGMKSLSTDLCYRGIEVLRQCCGGAGFSLHSGIAHLVLDYAPQITVEGENSVMAQQNSQYLLKQLGKVISGDKPKSEYIGYFSNIRILSELKCKYVTVEEILTLSAVGEMLKV